MQTRHYMIANWKLHGTLESVRAYVHALDAACWNVPAHITPIFAPPAPLIGAAVAARGYGSRVALACQDISAHDTGAFTGEASAAMMYELGARYAIIGHSERRQYHAEDDALIATKAKRAQEAGLIPILCVGETAEEALAGQTEAVLRRQLAATQGLDINALIIAYEPVWAIGTGKTPSPSDIATNHGHIIQIMHEAGDSAPAVVYGGSVKPENCPSIMALPEVAGALIGGASLQSDAMIAMLTSAKSATQKE